MERFYSKLVRLKVTHASCPQHNALVFLFQTGAIKSLRQNDFAQPSRCGFLFQTGAIKSASAWCGEVNFSVSIPNWCD